MSCHPPNTVAEFFLFVKPPLHALVRTHSLSNFINRFGGILGKAAVVGERLSPFVSLSCIVMAMVTLFQR